MRTILLTLGLITLLAGFFVGPLVSTSQAAVPMEDTGTFQGVTVLLKDGWRYRNVTITRDGQGAGFWMLRDDGAERLLDMDQITRVVDAAGNDITAQVLFGASRPTTSPPVTTPPPTEEPKVDWDGAYMPTPAIEEVEEGPVRPFRHAFGLEGGLGMPAGQYYEGLDKSWLVGARLRIGIHENNYIVLGGRYQDLGLEMMDTSGYINNYEVSSHLEIYDFCFGVTNEEAGRNQTASYFEMGAALVHSEFEINWDGHSSTYSKDYGSFVFRAGMLTPLSPSMGLDFGFTWLYKGMIFSEDDEPRGSILSLSLGLNWMS